MAEVRDRMVSDVVKIEHSTSAADAAREMIQQENGPLPVVEGDRPVAIVTDRDIAAHELVKIGLDQDVEEARQLMAQHELDRIPVVEGDRLVGIVSEADIRSDEAPLA